MSESELPEDVARWPTDPFRLLGVAPGVDPKELRRAYTRLIRAYKPEQFPEQFRRIREAYETLLHFAGGAFRFPTSPSPDPLAEPLRRPHGTDTAGPALTFEDEVRRAWEAACAGQEESAYHKLRHLEETHLGHGDLCLRLYWLLALQPELDPGRSPCDWLVRGLRASGLTGPLRELYRRELADNAREGLSPRCARLLDVPAPAGLIVDLLDWRWEAAGRLGEGGIIIAQDLEALRGRLAREDEDAWVRLLILAVQRLAWQNSAGARELLDRCRQEIEHLAHVHQRMRAEMDRLDHLFELIPTWRVVRDDPQVPTELTDLVRLSWDRPFADYRPVLHGFLAGVAEDPGEYLRVFDRVWERGRAVLTQLGQALASLGYVPPPLGPSSGPLVESLMEFVDAAPWRDYPRFRPLLLEFCLREALAPEWTGQTLADQAESYPVGSTHLGQLILDDWPLRYVWLAHRLFWA